LQKDLPTLDDGGLQRAEAIKLKDALQHRDDFVPKDLLFGREVAHPTRKLKFHRIYFNS
jgi:hypothetical protein